MLLPYDAQNPDEVTVTVGEVLEVLQFEEEIGWSKVKCPNGMEGLVPNAFVEPLAGSHL